MNIISKSLITINDKKVLFNDIVSITKWLKTLKIADINGDMIDIADEKMVKKFNDKIAEKPNFVYFENRFINLALVKSVNVVTNMANKIYNVVVDFGGKSEIFSCESEPAAEQFKKKITKAINALNSSKEAGLTK